VSFPDRRISGRHGALVGRPLRRRRLLDGDPDRPVVNHVDDDVFRALGHRRQRSGVGLDRVTNSHTRYHPCDGIKSPPACGCDPRRAANDARRRPVSASPVSQRVAADRFILPTGVRKTRVNDATKTAGGTVGDPAVSTALTARPSSFA